MVRFLNPALNRAWLLPLGYVQAVKEVDMSDVRTEAPAYEEPTVQFEGDLSAVTKTGEKQFS